MSNLSESRGNPPPVPPVVEGNPPPVPPVQTLSASRRGWFTSELAMHAMAGLLGALMVAGVFADGSIAAQIVGAAVSVLAAMGYGVSRSMTKGAEAKAMASAADSVARERALKAALAPDPTRRSRSTE